MLLLVLRQMEEEHYNLEIYNSAKTAFILLFALLFLVQPVFAQAELTIYLDERGNAEFFGTANKNISLPSGILLSEGEIRGSTTQLTSKQGLIWSFSFSLPDSNIQVILPDNSIVKDTSGEIFLSRNNIGVYAQDSIAIRYTLSQSDKNNNYLPIILSVIVALMLISLIFYYFKNKKIPINKKVSRKRIDKFKIIKNTLHERQQFIIENLRKQGKIKSSYLRKICNIPKASFSRHINELEKKGIIKKSGEGKNKFIELK